jgi:hypothetical protein
MGRDAIERTARQVWQSQQVARSETNKKPMSFEQARKMVQDVAIRADKKDPKNRGGERP